MGVSSQGRKVTDAPIGSDFAAPHRLARAATRTLLAKGGIAGSSDMPLISMGREGTWSRWVRKPSVAKTCNIGFEELDMNEDLMGIAGVQDHLTLNDDDIGLTITTAVALAESRNQPCVPFDANLYDPKAFPSLSLPLSRAEADKKSMPEVPAVDLTPEKVSQFVPK